MSGTDFKKVDAQLDKSASGLVSMVLKWSAQYGIAAVFALILLVQTNAKLEKLADCITRLTVAIESKK